MQRMGQGTMAQAQAIPPRTAAPSFDCASLRAPSAQHPGFVREQREFVANRNQCTNLGVDRQACIAFAHESRIDRLGERIDGPAWRGQ